MKKESILVIAAIVILLGIIGFYIFNQNSIPQNLEQANISETFNNTESSKQIDFALIPEIKNFSFTFTGYGPAGKFHDGSFKDFELGTSSIVFKSATVETGIDGLNKHLCAAEFFDCEKYAEIKFVAESVIQKSETDFEVAGTLSFKDITKKVLFNAKLENNKASADFLLDTTEFNFNPKLVENSVRIRFAFEI